MKSLSNLILLAALGGLLVLAGVRLTALLSNVPATVARVREQQEAIRPARLDVVVVTDGTCSTCTSPQSFIETLRQRRAAFTTLKQIDGTTEAGQQYLAQQKLERFPAVVVGGETSRHSELEQFLSQVGKLNGSQYVYYVPAPYREVASDKMRGLFRTTYLTSTACTTCYDVTRNAGALKNLGVNVIEDKVVTAESPEGNRLIQEYKIRYLPTIILAGDLEVYPNFQGVWPQVGTKEQDGTYVLREGVKLMGTYYDVQLKRSQTPQPAAGAP